MLKVIKRWLIRILVAGVVLAVLSIGLARDLCDKRSAG
jgi:hypothetical protein